MHAQRFRRAVAGHKAAQFSPRRFHGHKCLARRRRKSFRENLEVVDQRFHLRLHLLALRRHDAWRFGPHWTFVRNFVQRLLHDAQALPHLLDANHVPPKTVRIRARRHFELKLLVARIRKQLPVIVSQPCGAQRRPRHAQRYRVFRRDVAHALRSADPDAVLREQRLVFVHPARHHLQELVDCLPPARGRLQRQPADPEVAGHHALSREKLENLQNFLPLAEAVEENGHRSEVNRMRAEPNQMRRNPLQFRQHHSHVLRALRHLEPKQLLHRQAIHQVVPERIEVIHPVRQRDGLRIRLVLAALAPRGDRRMGANPHANGGRLSVELDLPSFRNYAVPVESPATERRESTRQLGGLLRDVFTRNADAANFRLMCPDETNSNRLGSVFEVENRCFLGRTIDIDDHVSPHGRVMEVLSEHLCEGWLEGYNLTGRHGLFATYEAFSMVAASMIVQHSKWLEEATRLAWRDPVPSLNVLLTSTCWRNDHNGFSHQGPGLIDVMLSKRGTVARIYLPPDANCLLSVADHCFRSRDYVNLIVIDKQPQSQYLDIETAIQHCAQGASVWEWAGSDQDIEPDVVLASAGDIPTMETLAAAQWLMERVPELRIRVVNVVDLMTLFPQHVHPHGMDATQFVDLFTADKPVIFAFHGYQRAVHEIVHGRPNADRFHVRGFNEQGTTTTPFDMVVLNGMSRYHLASLAIEFASRIRPQAGTLMAECRSLIQKAVEYSRQHLEDMPEIRDWTW